MQRNKLYQADDTLLIGLRKPWAVARYRALYGRSPATCELIKLDQPRFVAGPRPARPDTRWIPPSFLQTLPV